MAERIIGLYKTEMIRPRGPLPRNTTWKSKYGSMQASPIATGSTGRFEPPLCREFGINRVTGYKIYNRYRDSGLDGLNDRSRAPYRQANRLPTRLRRRS